MIDLQKPDWVRNLTTGILGVGFRLANEYELAFLADEALFSTVLADDFLGFFILKNGVRDLAGESFLFTHQLPFGSIMSKPFGPGRLLTIAAKDLQEFFLFAKKVFKKSQVA